MFEEFSEVMVVGGRRGKTGCWQQNPAKGEKGGWTHWQLGTRYLNALWETRNKAVCHQTEDQMFGFRREVRGRGQ